MPDHYILQVALNGYASLDTANIGLSDGVTFVDKMVATYNGNVGIGTTNPQAKLHIGASLNTLPANTSIAVNGDTTIRFTGGADGNSDYGSYISGNQSAGIRYITLGTRQTSTDTDGLTIKQGNVGIGTTSPGSTLDIRGTSSSYFQGLNIQNNASGGGDFTVMPFAGSLANAVAGDVLITNSVGNIIMSPNASGKSLEFIGGAWTNPVSMIINGNGNVGIGTTNPGAPLDVLGGIRATLINYYPSVNVAGIVPLGYSGGTGSQNWAIRGVYQYWNGVGNNASGGDLDLIKSQDGNTILATKTNGTSLGNVGIGTASPNGRLEISGQFFSTLYAGAVAIDWNNGNVQSFTLGNGGNTVSFSNAKAGAEYLLRITQPGSGAAGTITWSGNWKWPGGVSPVLTSTNGALDILKFASNGTNVENTGYASDIK